MCTRRLEERCKNNQIFNKHLKWKSSVSDLFRNEAYGMDFSRSELAILTSRNHSAGGAARLYLSAEHSLP
jgi:hypothetical protein